MDTRLYYNQKAKNYGLSSFRKKHIVDLITGGSLNILDIGCGTGILDAALKKRGHKITGVDISEEVLKVAKEYLSDSYCFNVEDENWPNELMKNKFDLIIASELIEHIFHPGKFINQAKQLLAEGGQFLITTPNFLYWKNRIKLSFGIFNYKEEGITDYGHIRFFSYRSLKKIFFENSLLIEKENHFYPEFFPQFYKKLFRLVGEHWPSFFAYQFIFLLIKIKHPNDKIQD